VCSVPLLSNASAAKTIEFGNRSPKINAEPEGL
jgi:hypothetical protein